MSVTYCLLVFLLCLSLHACNARRLAAMDTKPDNKFQFFSKNDERMGFDKNSVLPKAKFSLSKETKVTKGDSIVETWSVDPVQTPKDRKANQKIVKDGQGKTPGAVQNESLVLVSWHVPHKKRGEKQPGFNLDYSPPKTHPPSHN